RARSGCGCSDRCAFARQARRARPAGGDRGQVRRAHHGNRDCRLIAGLPGGGGLALPSPMRVVAGVVITLVLALGGIVALKKMLLKADGRWSSHGIRILGKAALGPSVRAHLLQVDASRVLVVEGRWPGGHAAAAAVGAGAE